MLSHRFFQTLLVLGTALFMVGTLLFFKQGSIPFMTRDTLVAQNSNVYLGPHKKTKGNSQLVRIQILVNDDPSPQGEQIVSASFNGQSIPLKPRDIYGFRGQASFQVRPDKYALIWEVNQTSEAWPRTVTHEEEVNVNPRDLWVQIVITGDQAAIQ